MQPPKHANKIQDDKTQDFKTQDDKTQDDKTQDDKTEDRCAARQDKEEPADRAWSFLFQSPVFFNLT